MATLPTRRSRCCRYSRAPAGKSWLGTFADSHLPYTVDRENDANLKKEVPTLADMTAAALSALEQNPAGFFLLVEPGDVAVRRAAATRLKTVNRNIYEIRRWFRTLFTTVAGL